MYDLIGLRETDGMPEKVKSRSKKIKLRFHIFLLKITLIHFALQLGIKTAKGGFFSENGDLVNVNNNNNNYNGLYSKVLRTLVAIIMSENGTHAN